MSEVPLYMGLGGRGAPRQRVWRISLSLIYIYIYIYMVLYILSLCVWEGQNRSGEARGRGRDAVSREQLSGPAATHTTRFSLSGQIDTGQI